MTSIVIAAHNEAAVIERTLDTLLAGAAPGELDVTVVANGCSDETAEIVGRRAGVRLVDLPEPGKAAALNAGDAVAEGFPRVYLDADIAVGAEVVRALTDVLDRRPHVLAAVPTRMVELAGRSLPVRAYFAIHTRLPAVREGLYGRGMIALSEAGRARFDQFPLMVADDLYLDGLFAAQERCVVAGVSTRVETPYDARSLVSRLRRVRRGNAAMRVAGRSGTVGGAVRPTDRWSWLRDVVVPRPWLAPAAVIYVVITLTAAVSARLTARSSLDWQRDESTRTAP